MSSNDWASVADTAKRLGISPRRIRQLLEAGRVDGAFKVANVWVIPASANPERNPRGRPRKTAIPEEGERT